MQFDHSSSHEDSHQKSQKDTGTKISPDEFQRMIDMAKLSAMRDLFLRNHPEWREREKGAITAGDGDGMARTPEEEEKRKRRRLTKPSQIPSSNSIIAKSLMTHSAYLSFIVGFLSRMRLYLQVWIHRRAVSCPYELSYDSYVTFEESDSHLKPRFTSTMCMLPSPKQLQTSCEPH